MHRNTSIAKLSNDGVPATPGSAFMCKTNGVFGWGKVIPQPTTAPPDSVLVFSGDTMNLKNISSLVGEVVKKETEHLVKQVEELTEKVEKLLQLVFPEEQNDNGQ